MIIVTAVTISWINLSLLFNTSSELKSEVISESIKSKYISSSALIAFNYYRVNETEKFNEVVSRNSEVLAFNKKCSFINVVSIKEKSYKQKFSIKVKSF